MDEETRLRRYLGEGNWVSFNGAHLILEHEQNGLKESVELNTEGMTKMLQFVEEVFEVKTIVAMKR